MPAWLPGAFLKRLIVLKHTPFSIKHWFSESVSLARKSPSACPTIRKEKLEVSKQEAMLEVYLDPCTVNSRKALAGLDLLGTPYHLNHIDYFTGQHKSPEYLKINPHGTVPSAIDGDVHITESNALLQHAADHTSSNCPPTAYPKDLKKRAKINCWLLWETSTWFPSCYVFLVEYVVKPLLKAEPDESVIEKETPKWNNLAGILDAQLAKTKWLCGDEVTIADIAVAAPMHLYEAQRLPLKGFPHLKRWLTEEVEKLPCWQKTQGAVEKALLPHKNKAETNGSSTGQANGNTSDPHGSVRAMFNFTKDLDRPPEIYFYETEAAKNIHDPGDDPQEVTVHDGWHRAKEFSIDNEGFSLHDFKTGHTAWEDEEAVRKDFYPEVVEFLKQAVGAKRVLVFDHTIRTKANAAKKVTQETNTSQRAPVMLVHCDYTAESGPARVKQLLPQEAEDLLSRRVAFINVWKPIHNVVLENPLAMCDATTTSLADDFFKLHLHYRDRDGENYVMRHRPDHKWWYLPQLNPQQLLLLKTYDSDTTTPGRARFLAHSAFADPSTPTDAPTRESVEIRTIAFF